MLFCLEAGRQDQINKKLDTELAKVEALRRRNHLLPIKAN